MLRQQASCAAGDDAISCSEILKLFRESERRSFAKFTATAFCFDVFQSMEATKKLLRQAMNTKLRDQLETEAKLLQEQWCSDECQTLFMKYLQDDAVALNK